MLDFNEMLSMAKKMVKELMDTKTMSVDELVKELGLFVPDTNALIEELISALEDLSAEIDETYDIKDALEDIMLVDKFTAIEFADELDLALLIDYEVDNLDLIDSDDVHDECMNKSLEDMYEYLSDADDLGAEWFIGDGYSIRNVETDDYVRVIDNIIDRINKAKERGNLSSSDGKGTGN